jgi:hypothetical protein
VNTAHDFGRRQEPRLLLECAQRLIALDHEDHASDGRIEGDPAPQPQDATECATQQPIPADAPSTGIAAVHRNLDYHVFADRMADARSITILNTWIPELSIIDALADPTAVTLDREEYPDPSGNTPSHREDLVYDLIALGATRAQILGCLPTRGHGLRGHGLRGHRDARAHVRTPRRT